MFRKERDPLDTRKDGLVRSGIRALSGGVGLLSETAKARKSSKLSPQTTHTTEGTEATKDNSAAPPSYSSSVEAPVEKNKEALTDEPVSEDDLEQEWALDDAQDELMEMTSHPPAYDEIDLTRSFQERYPPPPASHTLSGLSLPVVLPQRRPKDRSRGFVRAYAPILENAGITEPMWIDFLTSFQKSSTASPWLNVINLAGIGTMFIPHGLGFLAGFAINQIASTAIEFQSRERYVEQLTTEEKKIYRGQFTDSKVTTAQTTS
jgi:hypothetical protein